MFKSNNTSPYPLPYEIEKLPREMKKYYISLSAEEENSILQKLNLKSKEELFKHLDRKIQFDKNEFFTERLEYFDLVRHVNELASKNNLKTSFLGDGLPVYSRPDNMLGEIAAIRGLTTAYTPYQPERSQGTLMTLWMYASLLSELTGFEAVNASLYDRSTALVEGVLCAQRLSKTGAKIALISEAFYPNDKQVLLTHFQERNCQVEWVELDPVTGQTSQTHLVNLLQKFKNDVASVTFMQVNTLGIMEDVDQLTNTAHSFGVKVVAMVDPMHLAPNYLKSPAEFGEKGADIFVAEGQHLALGPIYGGPGLGIFGMRYNESDRQSVRAMPGRLVGEARDAKGRRSFGLVLSTREQHIRREKATSNICSNQSFVASLVGASLLSRGAKGLEKVMEKSFHNRNQFLQKIASCPNVSVAFDQQRSFNEVVLKLETASSVEEVIYKASREAELFIGVDVSSRMPKGIQGKFLKVSFNDLQGDADIEKLAAFFHAPHSSSITPQKVVWSVPKNFKRNAPMDFPRFSEEEIVAYYQKLGELNVSPDDSIYALGSCTMKYNPYINDYAAGLSGFRLLHPQAPLEDAQGSLELLFEIQEIFKRITGLSGVTTQPVAGAQGELVGIKMFQAYFRARGEADKRKVMIIPKTAHGTNPASASYAGIDKIVTLEATSQGEMDLEQLKSLVQLHGTSIIGMMVTNPNTSGIFEKNFHLASELIHSVGGLVYMDGANMNAVAGIVNIGALGVDAIHNNLHKTWSIPHGGGGPGDGIVAVSEKLLDFLPGYQVVKKSNGEFALTKMKNSIGEFHRHFGNFGHKVRCYTYLKALGSEGIRQMSQVSVLSARYLAEQLKPLFPLLPEATESVPRMHEFIITLSSELFTHVEKAGVPRAKIIAQIGKLFLDFGLHAPTVAFPEVFGLMIEPTESYSLKELDHFVAVVTSIKKILTEFPLVLVTAPHFTPVERIDEVSANKSPVFAEKIRELTPLAENRFSPKKLQQKSAEEVMEMIVSAHQLAYQEVNEDK